jgi:hypothetical protein
MDDFTDPETSKKASTLFHLLTMMINYMKFHPVTLLPITIQIVLPEDLFDVTLSIWDSVPFDDFKKLEVSRDIATNNSAGAVPDLELGVTSEDLIWKTENTTGLTMKQYTEGVFRMKRLKNDTYNELLSGIELTCIRDTLYMFVKFSMEK